MHYFTHAISAFSRISLLLLVLLCSSVLVHAQSGNAYSLVRIESIDYQTFGTDYMMLGEVSETQKGIAVFSTGNQSGEQFQPVAAFKPGTGLNGTAYAGAEFYGGLLVAGNFTAYNDTTANRIVLLKPNGVIDQKFDAGLGPNGSIRDVYVVSSSKIIIVGEFTTYNGQPANRIAQINSDGSLDNTFNVGDGANGSIYTIEDGYAPKTDGTSGSRVVYYLGGNFTSFDGTSRNRLARLNLDGSLDNSFSIGSGANGPVYAIYPEGENLMIGGDFTTFNGAARNRFATLTTSGAFSEDYNPENGFTSPVYAIERRDYEIMVGGEFGLGGVYESGNSYGNNYSLDNGTIVRDMKEYGYYGLIIAGSNGFKYAVGEYSISLDRISKYKIRPGDQLIAYFHYGGSFDNKTGYFQLNYIQRNGNALSSVSLGTTPLGKLQDSVIVTIPTEMEIGTYELEIVAMRNQFPFVEERYMGMRPSIEVAATEWTGAKSTDFGNAGNWTLGLPNSNTDVIIKSATRYPVLSSGSYDARNVVINQGASLKMVTGGTLNVRKNFLNLGIYIDEGGTLNPGTVGGESTTTFTNFTVSSSGVELAGPVAIKGVLTLKGNLKTNNRELILKADEDGTAYVNDEGGAVEGTVKVEGYVNGEFNVGPGYRHFSSPVASTTVSSLSTTNYSPVVNSAYNSAENPYTTKPFPTIFGYDESRLSNATDITKAFDFGWYSPSSSSSALVTGRAYSVNIPASAKVTLSGTLNSGDYTISGLGNQNIGTASGWHLLGNPYPSPIDWTKLTRSAGIDNAVYVYRSSGQYIGTFAAYVNGIGDEDARYIAPMQGFFVYARSNNQSFTFTNSARVYNISTSLYRTGADRRPKLQLKLKNAANVADEVYVYFQEEATSEVNGQYDAYKVQTYNYDRPTIFIRLAQEPLSIKGLPLNNNAYTVPLEFYVPENGTYTFSVASLVNFPVGAKAQLVDQEKNKVYDLEQDKEISLPLTIDDSPNRFALQFAAVGGEPLSVGEKADNTLLQVFPNPSQGDVRLLLTSAKLASESVDVMLYNALGQLVVAQQLKPSQVKAGVTLETSKLGAGVYHLLVKAGNESFSRKIVLQK